MDVAGVWRQIADPFGEDLDGSGGAPAWLGRLFDDGGLIEFAAFQLISPFPLQGCRIRKHVT